MSVPGHPAVKTRCAFVARENRCPLFGIMLQVDPGRVILWANSSSRENALLRQTYDNAENANRLHGSQMQELISKANQAILEAQWLRREGRSLRFEASVLASLLSETVLQSQRLESELSTLWASLDQRPRIDCALGPSDHAGQFTGQGRDVERLAP
ncbi:MAG TPA: hypothetical protein VHB49_03555 [Bradyrhizobium sp.]|nr:hypothetical protein [Bradyrhizobium sp.]